WFGDGFEVPYVAFPVPARAPDPCLETPGDVDCAVRDPLARAVAFPDVPACQDARDDDGDGAADAADPDCASLFGAAEDDDGVAAVECANGVDDDGDGLVDVA